MARNFCGYLRFARTLAKRRWSEKTRAPKPGGYTALSKDFTNKIQDGLFISVQLR